MTENSKSWSREFRVALQERLRDAGFYSGPIDGNFNEVTITLMNAYFNRSRQQQSPQLRRDIGTRKALPT
jgi:peptidoglycan hydrolase-like protein with peptidoglycan-binding domain